MLSVDMETWVAVENTKKLMGNIQTFEGIFNKSHDMTTVGISIIVHLVYSLMAYSLTLFCGKRYKRESTAGDFSRKPLSEYTVGTLAPGCRIRLSRSADSAMCGIHRHKACLLSLYFPSSPFFCACFTAQTEVEKGIFLPFSARFISFTTL